MAEPRDKQPPASIRHAMAALETLRAEDAALATTLEKSLPAYAMRLSQSGEAVEVDILLAIARQGEEALKDAFAALRPAQEEGSLLEKYTKIKAEIAASNAHPARSPTLAAPDPEKYPAAYLNSMLGAAAESGDIAAVRDMIAHGADINSNMGQALRVAVVYGHTETAALLLEHGASTDTIVPALPYAAKAGHIQTLKLIFKHSRPLIQQERNMLLHAAAKAGRTAVVALMLDQGVPIGSVYYEAMRHACVYGHIDVIRLLLDRDPSIPKSEINNALVDAAELGYTEIVALLLDRGADIHASCDAPLYAAAKRGHTNTVALLIDRGANIHAGNDEPLRAAAENGHNTIVAMLLERGANIHVLDDQPLQLAAVNGQHYDTAALLVDHGADIATVSPFHQGRIVSYMQQRERWQRTIRLDPPKGMESRDPAVFKPQFFADVISVLSKENYTGLTARNYAYNAVALFQNDRRLLQYLKKWATFIQQPLHNLVHMVKLPDDLSGINLSAWGDAVLQHGPKMAQMVKYCDRLPEPLRSEDGKSWSYLRTRAEVAKYAYNRAAEHPQLAALCFAHMVDEKDFDAALDIAQAVPPKVRDMPDIIIDGKRFGLEGTTFHKLANDDVRGLFLGELTDCCQSIGNAGNDCAEHGYTSPNGGFYVIETAQGEIIGQSWAWRGEQSELCLDSLETLGARVSQQQWKDLLKEIAQELTMRKNHGVSALHVGTGGATPHAFAQAFEQATAKPVDYSGYRDSRTQIRVWKR